ncbi:MAG: hypothetical protein FJ290_18920 [Planctomycetes bacterium]|nr:hypothetical protein [Planctomycetota bacterium]
MKRILIGIAVLAALGVAFYFVRELFTTERQRVERVVRRLERRIEARDPLGLCHLLTEDYRDANGFDRLSLRAFLTRVLPQLTGVSLRLEGMEIEVTGDEATANFTAYAVVEGRGEQPPWRHQSLVRLELRKAEGEWRVRRAEYSLPPIVRREERF